jgi:hypothetical protein
MMQRGIGGHAFSVIACTRFAAAHLRQMSDGALLRHSFSAA